MNTSQGKQKLYCYVDESGQDITSTFFIVAAVVIDKELDTLRTRLSHIETTARTGHRKWHKSRPDRRRRYLELVLENEIGKGETFYGTYRKPVPFFFPMLDVLERAITRKAKTPYTARVYIDGIDRKKAAELTNALRARNVSLELVKNRRDESEPLIRLADMWAGCIRDALLSGKEAKILFEQALKSNHLVDVSTKQQNP